MGQDNRFQVERGGNDVFSTCAAGKARESKKSYEGSKELGKKICGAGETSSSVSCVLGRRRQASAQNNTEMHLVPPWDISRVFSSSAPYLVASGEPT